MIQIKKISLFTSALSFVLGLVSCESVLDQKPYSEISEAQFWKDNNDANSGVAAIYDAMQDHYAQKYFEYGEFRSDNYVATGSERGFEMTTNALVPTSTYNEWTGLYSMISRANLAIEKIPQIPQYDPQLLAEAYALRAFAYFDAVRNWGAVPVFLDPVRSENDNLARPATNGATIMSQIVIPDMLKAEQLMTTPSDKFRFSQYGLAAFEASVYLWEQDYDSARERLEFIKNSNAYSLVDTREKWHNLFSNESGNGTDPKIQEGPELIFSIYYDVEAGDRSGVYSLFFAGIPNYLISPIVEQKWIDRFPTDSLTWVAKYPDPADLPKTYIKDNEGNETASLLFGDWRFYETRDVEQELGTARVAKWNKRNYSPSRDNTDIVLYRYADVILQLAEIENEDDEPLKALDYVNEIRLNRQLPLQDETEFLNMTKDEREIFILDERQFELFGEAKRFYDLRRTGRAIDVLGPINGQTEETLFFPYFFNHVENNPNLDQLPQYQ